MTSIPISKLDAARAQLDAAIELYFTTENPVAVHTLTAAAYNILRDIARKSGSGHPFLKTSFIDEYPEDKRKGIHEFINHPENFLKHADRDADGILDLNPEITEILLIDALAYFRDKDIPRPRYYDAMKVWLGVPREGLGEPARFLRDAIVAGLKASGKRKFWERIQQHLTAGSRGDAPQAARA